MAATVRTSFIEGIEGATSHTLSNVTNTSGDLLVAFLALNTDEVDQAAISDSAGFTWTKQVSDTSDGQEHNMVVWTAPADGTTTDVTVDSWTTASDGVLSVVVVQDTSQSVGATASNSSSGTTSSIDVTITTTASDSLLISTHASSKDNTGVPTGFTQIQSHETQGAGSANLGMQVATKSAAGGNDNHTWGDDFAGDRNVAAIEIKAAAGGGTTGGTRSLLTLGVGA